MDYKRREEIFSKEYIDTRELQELFGISQLQNASKLMVKIKEATGDTLGIKGKIHISDYLKYFHIETERYKYPFTDTEIPESIHPIRKIDFSAGYYEWNVYINDEVAYSFNDFSEIIEENTRAEDLVDMLIDEMKHDEEKGVHLNRWEEQKLKEIMIEKIINQYGLDKEN